MAELVASRLEANPKSCFGDGGFGIFAWAGDSDAARKNHVVYRCLLSDRFWVFGTLHLQLAPKRQGANLKRKSPHSSGTFLHVTCAPPGT